LENSAKGTINSNNVKLKQIPKMAIMWSGCCIIAVERRY